MCRFSSVAMLGLNRKGEPAIWTPTAANFPNLFSIHMNYSSK